MAQELHVEHLTEVERERLNRFKLAYVVYSDLYPTFTMQEIKRLVFARFLYSRGLLVT